MKKLIFGLVVVSLAMPAVGQSTYVKPHVRKDGTYVQGHYRTKPNETKLDNYSSQGNYNPYTGRTGTVDPYAPPTYTPYNSPRTTGYQPYTPPCYYNCKK